MTASAEPALPAAGGSETASVTVAPLPATQDPAKFAKTIAEQLWTRADTDHANYRILHDADPDLTDDQLDSLASAVDVIRSQPTPTRVAAVTVADPDGLIVGQRVTVSGADPGATVVIRVHCQPICQIEGIQP